MAINADLNINNNDIFIINGDFIIAESDEQHILDSLNSFPGYWKQNPLDGVGIRQYQNAVGIEQDLARKINVELASDGYQSAGAIVAFDATGRLNVNPNAYKV